MTLEQHERDSHINGHKKHCIWHSLNELLLNRNKIELFLKRTITRHETRSTSYQSA